MRKFKFRWIVLALVAAPFVYNLDAFYGAWKFSRLCKNEGGPRYYAVVERKLGWEVDNRVSGDRYKSAFQFEDIAFVRFNDKAGRLMDAYATRHPWPKEPDYSIVPANESRLVRYRYVFERNLFPDDARMSKEQDLIFDKTTGRLAASFTQFGYRWTSPDRVILAAPTGVRCEFLSADYEKFRRSIFLPPISR